MSEPFNCYISVVAGNVGEARISFLVVMGLEPINLIHVERSEEPEEGDTYVFSFEADVVNEDGDSDMLHDHFNLPNHINLPYEAV